MEKEYRINFAQLRQDALTNLAGIRQEMIDNGLNPYKVDKTVPVIDRAISNLDFINNKVRPAISELHEEVGLRLEITSPSVAELLISGLSVSAEGILYRGNIWFNGQGLVFSRIIPGGYPLDQDALRLMWEDKRTRGFISKLSKLSKDSILKKFENKIRKH